MKRLVASALVFAALAGAAACGVDADDGPRAIPTDDLQASQAPGATTTTAEEVRDDPVGEPVPIEIYFAREADEDGGVLQAVTRNVSSPATESAVLDALFLDTPTGQRRFRTTCYFDQGHLAICLRAIPDRVRSVEHVLHRLCATICGLRFSR